MRKTVLIFILFAVAIVVLVGFRTGEITIGTVTAQDGEPGPTPIPTVAPPCEKVPPCECPGRACIRISDGP